jgi:hypothetical protein
MYSRWRSLCKNCILLDLAIYSFYIASVSS